MSKVLVDLSDDEGGEEGGASKPKKEEPEDLGIPNVAVGSFPFARIQNANKYTRTMGNSKCGISYSSQLEAPAQAGLSQ